MESLILALCVLTCVLALVAALGAWRPSSSSSGSSDPRMEQALAELKGGLIGELGRVRASVEAGIREATESARATQHELHQHTGRISAQLHEDLQRQFDLLCHRLDNLIEMRFGQLVAGTDRRFDIALAEQRADLQAQLDQLVDLRRAIESNIISLRKDVAQYGTNAHQAVVTLGARTESDLDQLEFRLTQLLGHGAPVRVASHQS